MKYAELLCKTNYSFLRGASHSHELMARAAQVKLEALAITDVGGVYGMPKAYHALKDLPEAARPKLIVGAEIPIVDHPSITLLAQNRAAYGLLCRILTECHRDRPKAKPLISWQALLSFLEDPESKSKASGLIAILTSAPGTRFGDLKEIFKERIALPLFRFLDGQDSARTEYALDIRNKFEIPIIASNDVHFHVRERRKLQDVLTSIREGVPVKDAGFKLFSNSERYIKSPEQMRRLFQDLPEALHQTVKIAESCTFSPSELKYRYPSEWIPQCSTSQNYLEELVEKGAHERYRGLVPEAVVKQLAYELALIKQLEFADYFLTVEDIVRWARAQGILCQGRGSAANSSVCFCLGITAVDPVKMKLLFERFISPERGEPPDIDVDFEHERREEVIQYVYRKYGRDRAAMVSAVVTYRSRSALREVAKALGVGVGTLSARKVEQTFAQLLEGTPKLKANLESLLKSLRELKEELEGFPRHLSIHSGGFTLSADPIIEIVPVEPASMEGRTIVQWDKYDLDILGLLKVDLLSLGMLSALRKTLQMTGRELHEIPADDPKTYEMIRKADTVGTFQIESRAQMSMLPRLLPRNFYDLVIEVALVRPGPIVGQMVHPYLKRRRGEEKFTLPHPKLESILGRTLGVPLFQEQVMQLAIELAGFTPGEADQLRRAIGAWRSSDSSDSSGSSGSVDQMGRRLMTGLLEHGLPESFADTVFSQMKGFAEYGFPESHAASFALLAYASAFLKCHHPAEFCCALINSQPMGFYASHTLIDDAKRHGVKVLPLHPNLSEWDCKMEGNQTLRLGFRVVHGIARGEVDRLLIARDKNPFSSLPDFLSRSHLRKNIIRTLALGDTFRCFNVDQRNAFWGILASSVVIQPVQATQLSLFSGEGLKALKAIESESVFAPLDEYQAIYADYESFGLSLRGHPMEHIRKKLTSLPRLTTAGAKKIPNGRIAEIAGLAIVMQRPPTAKGTVFATLEDETGFLDLILWGNVFETHHHLIVSQGFIIVKGQIQREGDAASMLVQSVRAYSFAPDEDMVRLGEDMPRSLSEGVIRG